MKNTEEHNAMMLSKLEKDLNAKNYRAFCVLAMNESANVGAFTMDSLTPRELMKELRRAADVIEKRLSLQS